MVGDRVASVGERLPLCVGRFLDGLRPWEMAGQREAVTALQAFGEGARLGRAVTARVCGVSRNTRVLHFDCLNSRVRTAGNGCGSLSGVAGPDHPAEGNRPMVRRCWMSARPRSGHPQTAGP
jgi:hypothetical protein